MKRVLIWILVLQFTTGHNLLAELVRMPSLLEHFDTHRQEAPGLGFAGFLWLHYLDTSHTHPDNSHAQLPLHCMHGVMAESVLPQPPCVVCTTLPPDAARSAQPLLEKSILPADFSRGLFRPPIA